MDESFGLCPALRSGSSAVIRVRVICAAAKKGRGAMKHDANGGNKKNPDDLRDPNTPPQPLARNKHDTVS